MEPWKRKYAVLKIVRLQTPVECGSCGKEILAGSVALKEGGNFLCMNCNDLPSPDGLPAERLADPVSRITIN